jgi:hypothetical protein
MQQKYQKVNEIWPFLTVLPDGAIRVPSLQTTAHFWRRTRWAEIGRSQ